MGLCVSKEKERPASSKASARQSERPDSSNTGSSSKTTTTKVAEVTTKESVVSEGSSSVAPSTTTKKEKQNVTSVVGEEDFIVFEPIGERYELGEEIGKGGFSVVYKAKRIVGGEEFAVKCIKKKMVEGDDIKLLRREIQIMKKLSHDNILKLYEVYEDEDSFYLVMELVRGKELFDKIVDRGMYSERDAARIIHQVVSAVEYLHENGIAHRDLKPENLLSAGDGEAEIVKIADFGFSKNFGAEDGEKLMTSCGSPGYVAPEILTAESYDKSVDMWSVGVIIYILLSGYPPFYADSAPALFKKIMDVKYDFDDSVWDDISDTAKDLIRNLLVKDPSKRFTANQCLNHPWITGKAKTKAVLQMKKVPDK